MYIYIYIYIYVYKNKIFCMFRELPEKVCNTYVESNNWMLKMSFNPDPKNHILPTLFFKSNNVFQTKFQKHLDIALDA